ncbi:MULTISPECIES: hypothetical protein [unclassified Streptomyces]|uniref:hypothetical protein n=1 Tax=unclassified Streptomyces TaxID=2593676 RepID=UPI0033D27D80
MSELDVDSEGLDRSGEAVKDVSGVLKVARDEYVDKITSYRGCWGTGEFGETFAKKYYQGLGLVVDGTEALVKALESSGQSLNDTSKKFKKTQQDVIDHVNTGTTKKH